MLPSARTSLPCLAVRIPDDWIDANHHALFLARDVMRVLVQQL